MFAPKVARPQPATGARSTAKFATHRSALVAQIRTGAFDSAPPVQRKLDQGQVPVRKGAGPSFDFSKISIFPPNQQPSSVPLRLQPKLAIGAVNDPLEHEADRVAEQVMRMPDPDLSIAPAPVKLSRKCTACEEEDKAKMLRPKPAGPAEAPASEAPPIVHEVLRSPGQPLDAATRAFFEPRFGRDFLQVRVHDDERSNGSAHAVGALAYTVGSDIVFASGRSAQGTHVARRLLAHELTHVIQQSGHSDTSSGHKSPKVTRPAQILQRQNDAATSAGGKSYKDCVNDTLASMGILSSISELVWAACGIVGVAAGILGTLVEPGGGTLTGWGLAVAGCVAFATGVSVGKLISAMLACA